MITKMINGAAFSLYNTGWKIAIPLLKKNKRLSEGYAQRQLTDIRFQQTDIWIQAASGGEAYLALSLLETLRFSTLVRILVTTNTAQGIEILEKGKAALSGSSIELTITYAPFDQPDIMEKALTIMAPKVMVLLELEMWPGLMKALKKHRCRTLIVNGRLTEHSLSGYLKWPSLWRDIAPEKILAISGKDAERFTRLFPESDVSVMSNIKFDRVNTNLSASVAELSFFSNDSEGIIVLGSIRMEEELLVEQMVHYILQQKSGVSIFLFPRHMERIDYWGKVLDRLSTRWELRSKIDLAKERPAVILWDVFGELMPAYRAADAAFVGGSLVSLGGQNFLEVLSAGLIPVTGPYWDNFVWTGQEIIDQGLLYKEDNWQKSADRLLHQLDNPVRREDVKEKLAVYLAAHQGGTQAACKIIRKIYDNTH